MKQKVRPLWYTGSVRLSQIGFRLKLKVVIKVSMNGQKSRSKALRIAVGVSGVESAALQGQDKSQIEVTGHGFDAITLTTLIRKNVGYAELVSCWPEERDREERESQEGSKNQATVQPLWATTYPPAGAVYLYKVPNHDPSCSML